MEKFTAVAEISFYSIENKIEHEHIVITEVTSFTDAMTRIEAYYGNDLDTVNITLLTGEFLIVSKETANRIIHEEVI